MKVNKSMYSMPKTCEALRSPQWWKPNKFVLTIFLGIFSQLALNFFLENPISFNILLIKTGLLILRGKKSKISRDFQEQIHGKIGQFRGIFAGKKSKFAEQSADFAGEKSGGKFAKKQSVNNSRFRWIFLANFAKIDQFCVDMTSVGERFFNRDNHLLFQQQFTWEMSEC